MKIQKRPLILMLLLGLISLETDAATQYNFPILTSVRNIVQRLTNTTIGVVRGGLNIMNGAFLRIINRVGRASDKVADLLEEVRKYMPIGIPELGIPRLEPLTVDKLEFDINHEVARLKGRVTNVEVRQLSKFRLDQIDISLPKVSVNITFPYVEITGFYDIDGIIGNMFRIFGDGPFWLKAQGLSIATELELVLNSASGIYVQDMTIDLKLTGMQNCFQNLMHDEELGTLFNKVISRLAPEAVDMIWPEVKASVEQEVKDIINEILKDSLLNNTFGRLLNIFNLNTG